MIRPGVRAKVRATALRNALVDRSIKRDPNWVNWPENDLHYMSKGKLADIEGITVAQEVDLISAPVAKRNMSVTYPSLYSSRSFSTASSMPTLLSPQASSQSTIVSSVVDTLFGYSPTAPPQTEYSEFNVYGEVPGSRYDSVPETEFFSADDYDMLALRPRPDPGARRMNKKRHAAEEARLAAMMNAPVDSMNIAVDPVEQARREAMMNAPRVSPADVENARTAAMVEQARRDGAMNAAIDPVEKARSEAMMNAPRVSPADVENARAAAMVEQARREAMEPSQPNILEQIAGAVVTVTSTVADAMSSVISAEPQIVTSDRGDFERAKSKFYRAYRNQPQGRVADRGRAAKTIVTDVAKYQPKRNDFKGLDDRTGTGAFAPKRLK